MPVFAVGLGLSTHNLQGYSCVSCSTTATHALIKIIVSTDQRFEVTGFNLLGSESLFDWRQFQNNTNFQIRPAFFAVKGLNNNEGALWYHFLAQSSKRLEHRTERSPQSAIRKGDQNMKPVSLLFVLAILFVLAACGRAGDSEEAAAGDQPLPGDQQSAGNIDTPQPPATDSEVEVQPPAGQDEAVEESPASTAAPPIATIPPESTELVIMPIEVTYFTPGQMEGPYYPVNKLDDRDNDLTVLEGAAGVPAGEVIEFTGKVYDAAGMPVSGIVIEIWQTDESGVYLHPGDPGTDQRDRNFQFYGEAITAEDGSYGFRTILPGHYEPRPRHIHVKVRYDGNELLTTQFYFEGDPELAGEAMFNQASGDGVQLIISLTEGQDAGGGPILIGQRDIILNVDLPG